MKYLLLLALIVVIWWTWKKRSALPPDDGEVRREPDPEKMVVCAHCGVHLPESDSIADGQANYCNAAHRDAARAAKR
jgi:uncharacterized protein